MAGRLSGIILASSVILVVLALSPKPVLGQTYSVTISIAGLPTDLSTKVYVDGVYNTTLRGGESRTYNFSATDPPMVHTISVDVFVPNPSGMGGTRYQAKAPSWSFSGSGSHIFGYTTQYYLEVASPYGATGGSGWYDAGSKARATISPSIVDGNYGVRYVFTSWGGDATGTEPASDEILMDRPKKAIANWRTQYQLAVNSEPAGLGEPKGAGWYDAGSTAQFSVTQVISQGEDTRYVFSSWSGDFSGNEPKGSIVMDGPKAVTARFKLQHRLTLKYVPPEVEDRLGISHQEWYDAGAEVTLGPIPQYIEIATNERLRFIEWLDNGKPVQGLSVTFTMDEPRLIEVRYRIQYYLRVMTNYGKASGEGWYDAGDKAIISVKYPLGGFVKYSLSRWRASPQATLKRVGENSWEIVMDKAYTLEAIWSIDYTPAIFFLVGTLAAVGALTTGVVLAVKRPGFLSALRRGSSSRLRGASKLGTIAWPAGPGRSCVGCNNPIPASAAYCHICGSPQTVSMRQSKPILHEGSLDEGVFNYIAERGGTISLSQASKDLGLTMEELESVIERLKRKGWLA